MVKLCGVVRPQVAVLDDELPYANETRKEGYEKHSLQQAAQVLGADHQIHRQKPDEKQHQFSNRKQPYSGVRSPEKRNYG